MTDGFVTYFAYGSCMSPQDFQRTVPQFELLGAAVIDDYRLAFTSYSEGRMGGVADIVRTPEARVEGVLYRFPAAYLHRLDEREGVPNGVYERITVVVHYADESVPAETYSVIHKAASEIPPSDVYGNIVLEGARLLSDDYRSQLERHIDDLQKSE